MKHLAFILSMPNCGSWNGKWSAAKNLYARVRSYTERTFDKQHLIDEAFYYSWNDGWTACVKVEEVDLKEKNKILKKSRGFYGYDWMIDSIIRNGEITR